MTMASSRRTIDKIYSEKGTRERKSERTRWRETLCMPHALLTPASSFVQFGQTGFVYFIWYDADLLTLTVRKFYTSGGEYAGASLFNWDCSTFRRRYTKVLGTEKEKTQARRTRDYLSTSLHEEEDTVIMSLCELARNSRYSWWHDAGYVRVVMSYEHILGCLPVEHYRYCKSVRDLWNLIAQLV